MPAEIHEIGPCKKRIRVTVPRDRVRQELEKNYSQLTGSVALPGFRKGRVPRGLLEKRFGKTIEQEIEQSLIAETLQEALEENKLQALGEPKLEKREFDKEKDPALEYEATVAVRPEFEVPSLEGVRVEKAAPTATDDEVLESLEHSRRARGEMKPTALDATVGPEDAIVVDVEFLAGGETKRREENGHVWVKNDRVGPVKVEKLAEKLAGKKRGDVVEIEVELPKSLGIEGTKTGLRLFVKDIKEIVLPALDDAFAKEAGFDSLKEMKEEVRSRILRAKDEAANAEVEQKIIDALLAKVSFDLPDDIVEQELDEVALRTKLRSQYQGKSEEDAAADAGAVRSASRDEVVRRLKGIFLLDKIARDQKIFATEEDVRQAVARMAERYGRSPEEVAAELESSGSMARLRYDLRMDKAKKWLRSKVEVVEK